MVPFFFPHIWPSPVSGEEPGGPMPRGVMEYEQSAYTSVGLRLSLPVYTRIDLAGIALGDLVAVGVAEPLDGLEDGDDFLEIPARLRVNGIDSPKHLGGEQDIVHPYPFNQQLHSLSVVNGHIPVHPTGGLFKRLKALSHMHATMPIPLIRDGPTTVRNNDLQGREVLEDARAEQLHGARVMLGNVVGNGRMHCRVDGRTGVDGAGDIELDHLLPQRIPPFIAQRGCEGLAASGLVWIDITGDKPLLFDTALQFFHPALGADVRRLGELAHWRDFVRKEATDARNEVVAGFRPVAADQFRAKVMPHG